MSDEVDGWTEDARTDGRATVKIDPSSRWWAITWGWPPTSVTACPCCHRPFGSARVAKLVANHYWPIEDAQ